MNEVKNKLQINELYLAGAGSAARACRLFKFELKDARGPVGVFGIIEIETPRFRALRIASALINTLENFCNRELESSNLDTGWFEKILQFFNKELVDLLNQEKIIFNPKYFNIVIGASQDAVVRFSKFGLIDVNLLHQGASGGAQIINLESKLESEEKTPKPPTKLLSQLLEGAIQLGDKLIFTNYPLGELLAAKEILSAAKLPAHLLLKEIKKILAAQPATGPWAVIAVGAEALQAKKYVAADGQAPPIRQQKEIIIFDLREFKKQILSGLLRLLKLAGIFLLRLLQFIFMVTTNWKGQRRPTIQHLRQNIDAPISSKISRFNSLPRLSKFLVILACTILFIFTQSVLIRARFALKDGKNATLEKTINNLNANRAAAENFLIYGDLDSARPLLARAKAELRILPARAKNLKSFQNLLANLASLERRAWKIEIPAIEQIAAIPNPDKIPFEFLELLLRDNKIYLMEKSAIYKYDLAGKTLEKILPPANSGEIKNGRLDPEENRLIAYFGNKQFAGFDDDWSALAVAGGDEIRDFTIFNDKLYVFDGRNIFRFRKTIDGYSQKEKWNVSELDGGAWRFIVDGAIYLARDNYAEKLWTGRSTGVVFEKLDDEFSSTAIWTNEESKFVYLSSGRQGRVAVYNKDGKLTRQYQLSGNVSAFLIDEKEKLGYFTNGNKLYRWQLTHLDKKIK